MLWWKRRQLDRHGSMTASKGWTASERNQKMALTSMAQLVACRPTKQKLPVGFLVRAHAWVAGLVLGLMFLSDIDVSLTLSLPSLNKIFF